MVNAMDAAIGAGADGIGVAIVDLEAFNAPTDKALAAGIPVISYNADAPNKRLAYVGQDLYGSGYAMGERIVELVGSGKVGLFIATPGQLNIQPRIDGALDAIRDSGADIEALDIATGADLTEELNNVEAWYLGNQDAVGMFAVDAGSTQAVGQVVQSQGARDKGLKAAGGYDLLPLTVEMVADGTLDFTIDQQPYLQGFLPVVYLYLWKLSGGVVTPPETNTGLVFLDSASAKLFLDTQSRFEGDDSAQKVVSPVG
jgi:simple sugar transport system substrate-binding protein